MRRISILCFGVLALAGCGGDGTPALDRSTATALAEQAAAVAARAEAGDACGARDYAVRLQRRTIAAINGGRVPPPYQEPLQARANRLVSELEPECLPSVAPEATWSDEPQTGDGDDGERDARPGKAKKWKPKPWKPKRHGRGDGD